MVVCSSMTACALTAGDCPSVTPSPEAPALTTTNSIAPSSSTSTTETSTSTGGHAITSTSIATDMGAEDNPQGASGSTALVGGVVGVLSGGALVVVLVLVVVLCVKRSRRKLMWQAGITNVLYGGGHKEKECVSNQTYSYSLSFPAGGGPHNINYTIFLDAGEIDTYNYSVPVDAVVSNPYI